MSDESDVGGLAGVFAGVQVEEAWAKWVRVLPEALGLGTCEFEDSLLGIGEGNKCAARSDRLHNIPLVGTRILELIKDDERGGATYKTPNFVRGIEKSRDKWCKAVEAHLAFLFGQPHAFSTLPCRLLGALRIGELRLRFVAPADRRESDGFVRRRYQFKAARETDEVTVGS